MFEKAKEKFKRIRKKIKLRVYTIKFVLGILDETMIYTHKIGKPLLDINSGKVVKSIRDVVKYARDISQPNRYIDGRKVKYNRTISVFSKTGKFFFVVLYE